MESLLTLMNSAVLFPPSRDFIRKVWCNENKSDKRRQIFGLKHYAMLFGFVKFGNLRKGVSKHTEYDMHPQACVESSSIIKQFNQNMVTKFWIVVLLIVISDYAYMY